MELNNEFSVSVPVDQAWAVLTDLERIAPCMPGAQLQEVEGDEYRGIVKVKVGPITAQYRGSARFVELDKDGHRAVLKAEGRDTRGQGNASATVVATLVPGGSSTTVGIQTDLSVTGKVAQFGRGVLADVSAKLLDQFVKRLEADVLSGESAGEPTGGPVGETSRGLSVETSRGPGGETSSRPGGDSVPEMTPSAAVDAGGQESPNGADRSSVRTIQSGPVEPVNLIDAAGSSIAKRLIPAGIALLLVLLVWRAVRGR